MYAAGATSGTVTDFGNVRTVSFRDPDGMEGEIAQWQAGELLTFAQRRQHHLTMGYEHTGNEHTGDEHTDEEEMNPRRSRLRSRDISDTSAQAAVTVGRATEVA